MAEKEKRTKLAGKLGREPIRLEGTAFGLHPLYLKVHRGEVLVSSRACDLADSHAKVDVDRLCALLAYVPPIPASASPFESVARVPPDASVIVEPDGAIRVVPRPRPLAEVEMSAVDAAEEIWCRIQKSVGDVTRDSKHVAVITGGGLDSSAVLAAALAAHRGAGRADVDAVALHFAGEGDDRPHMQELERELGILAVKVSPSDAASAMLPLLEAADTPGWGWSLPTDLALFRAARERGADMALTGLGGDELFDGLPRMLADDFARGDIGAPLRAARLTPSYASPLAQVGRYIVRPLLGRAMPLSTRRARRRRAILADLPFAGPSLRRFAEKESAQWTLPSDDSASARFDSIAKANYIADGVELCEMVAARANIRVAHPLLDTSLLELVSQLSPTFLLHASRRRGLFRLAMRGRVPSGVRLRMTKASFINAWSETLRVAGGGAVLADLASMRECASLGIVDASAYRDVFARIDRDGETWTSSWPALGIEGFLRARARLARA